MAKNTKLFFIWVVVLVVLPILLSILTSGSFTISSIPTRYGSFYYMAERLYKDPAPLDVVFIGSSTMLSAIDCRALEENFERDLGKKVKVANFSHVFDAPALQYHKLKYVLTAKKPKVIFLEIPTGKGNYPFAPSRLLLDVSKDKYLLKNLNWGERLQYIKELYLSLPRRIQHFLLLSKKKPLATYGVPESLGTQFNFDGFKRGDSRDSYVDLNLGPPKTQLSDIIVDPSELSDHKVTNKNYLKIVDRHNNRILTAIIELANSNGVPLYFVSFPRPAEKTNQILIDASFVYDHDVGVLGVSWEGLGRYEDKLKESLFRDNYHLNRSGARFYSEIIYPGILSLIDRNNTHSEKE